jgi:hypothetical protein
MLRSHYENMKFSELAIIKKVKDTTLKSNACALTNVFKPIAKYQTLNTVSLNIANLPVQHLRLLPILPPIIDCFEQTLLR